jgi:hypothetical protein
MRNHYRTYAEIPPLVEDYILTVAEKKHIMTISLEEINSFLDGLHEHLMRKEEEFSEGWA